MLVKWGRAARPNFGEEENMKKLMKAAAVLVLAAASSAKAGEEIDFDGKKGAPLFSELVAQTVPGTEAIIPERVFAAAPD